MTVLLCIKNHADSESPDVILTISYQRIIEIIKVIGTDTNIAKLSSHVVHMGITLNPCPREGTAPESVDPPVTSKIRPKR